jgi:predicted site-specific integrase-resolvase
LSVDFSMTVGPSSAARILGISTQHVKRLADAGKLHPFATPLGRLFDRDEVERLAAERAREWAAAARSTSIA